MLCPQLCQAASTYRDADDGGEGIDGGGDGSDGDDRDQLAKTWMEAEIVSGYQSIFDYDHSDNDDDGIAGHFEATTFQSL